MNYLKKSVLLFIVFFLQNVYGEVPSDIKRTEIKLEKDKVDMFRVRTSATAGVGSSQSSFTPQSYGFKNVDLGFGTKFVLGSTYRDGSFGLAISPDLNLKLRLDDSGKKIRLEADGHHLISLLDIQTIYVSDFLSRDEWNKVQQEIASSEKKIQELKQSIEKEKQKTASSNNSNGGAPNHSKIIDWQNQIAHHQGIITEGQKKLERDEKSSKNPEAYATFDYSILNFGAKYKEAKDASYKFVGGSGSLFALSFDLATKLKGSNVSLGICGVVDLVTMKMGKHHNAKIGERNDTSYGFSGSLCAKIGTGPILLTNTLNASYERAGHGEAGGEKDPSFMVASVNNTARLDYKTEVIPGAISKIGAYYSYDKESYPGGEISSHSVGLGLTVLVK